MFSSSVLDLFNEDYVGDSFLTTLRKEMDRFPGKVNKNASET